MSPGSRCPKKIKNRNIHLHRSDFRHFARGTVFLSGIMLRLIQDIVFIIVTPPPPTRFPPNMFFLPISYHSAAIEALRIPAVYLTVIPRILFIYQQCTFLYMYIHCKLNLSRNVLCLTCRWCAVLLVKSPFLAVWRECGVHICCSCGKVRFFVLLSSAWYQVPGTHVYCMKKTIALPLLNR